MHVKCWIHRYVAPLIRFSKHNHDNVNSVNEISFHLFYNKFRRAPVHHWFKFQISQPFCPTNPSFILPLYIQSRLSAFSISLNKSKWRRKDHSLWISRSIRFDRVLFFIPPAEHFTSTPWTAVPTQLMPKKTPFQVSPIQMFKLLHSILTKRGNCWSAAGVERSPNIC